MAIDIPEESKHTWINGKLFLLGVIVDDYNSALRIKRLLEGDKIEVKLVRKQPPPLWEIWAHDTEGKFQLTVAGRAQLTAARLETGSLCFSCEFGRVIGDVLICDYGSYPTEKKKRCKFYNKRGSK